MKLKCLIVENYRAIEQLELSLDPDLTVFHGDNAHGKTSVLSAIAVALGRIPTLLPGVSGIDFRKADRRATIGPCGLRQRRPRVSHGTGEWWREESVGSDGA